MSPWLTLALAAWAVAALSAGYALWHRWILWRRLHPGSRWTPADVRGAMDRGRLPALSLPALLAFFFWLGLHPLPAAALSAAAAWGLGRLAVRHRLEHQERQLEEQLPWAAWHLAAALRSGRSLGDCLGQVGGRLPPPSADWLQGLHHRLALGESLDEELLSRTARGSMEARLAAVLLLHRRSAANLPQALTALAASLSRELALREEVQAATAEARTTSALVAVLPVATLALLRLALPTYLEPLLKQPAGWILMVVFLATQVLALSLVRSMVRSLQ